ncbi:Exodeoxyribonuclease V beta chain [Burkholderia vietnamiensis]|nr:Exodeoxyribonuclease V beta chain [Burkholderia vietnamiensis]
MRSRSGTSRRSARCSTMSRLGCARPDSTKLRCRADTSASSASAIWLRRRRCRQVRSNGPMPDARPADDGSEWRAAVEFMGTMIGNPARAGYYLRGKRWGYAGRGGRRSGGGEAPEAPEAPEAIPTRPRRLTSPRSHSPAPLATAPQASR